MSIPPAVAKELADGKAAGWDVPDVDRLAWISVRVPVSSPALPLAADLGRGEAAVLALALESRDPIVILDDGVGKRRPASGCLIPITIERPCEPLRAGCRLPHSPGVPPVSRDP